MFAFIFKYLPSDRLAIHVYLCIWKKFHKKETSFVNMYVCVICIYCKCHRYYVHFSSGMNHQEQQVQPWGLMIHLGPIWQMERIPTVSTVYTHTHTMLHVHAYAYTLTPSHMSTCSQQMSGSPKRSSASLFNKILLDDPSAYPYSHKLHL